MFCRVELKPPFEAVLTESIWPLEAGQGVTVTAIHHGRQLLDGSIPHEKYTAEFRDSGHPETTVTLSCVPASKFDAPPSRASARRNALAFVSSEDIRAFKVPADDRMPQLPGAPVRRRP